MGVVGKPWDLICLVVFGVPMPHLEVDTALLLP